MKRTTEKRIVYAGLNQDGPSIHNGFIIFKDIDEAYRKLYVLEDIEEEIGIDLITLFKALKYGVYYYTSQNQLTHDYVWLYDNYVSASVRDKLSYSLLTCFQKQILSFEDYGATWSIYRENLEDDTD